MSIIFSNDVCNRPLQAFGAIFELNYLVKRRFRCKDCDFIVIRNLNVVKSYERTCFLSVLSLWRLTIKYKMKNITNTSNTFTITIPKEKYSDSVHILPLV